MTFNFTQISEILNIFEEMKNIKMPFKLSLILAKNITALKTEYDFFLEREREFVVKYLETDEEGNFIQEQPNVFKIKDGLEKECQEARIALDNFTVNIDLRMIPMNLIENMEFTPQQLTTLEVLIEEE